ncbi:NUDIX hydrolase [uncultured Massilia sp.]|uniref:NUDIX hydrolase n=1 Tax=uncultured Massilia sp. TaxID=169973 RepID=UPI0025E98D9A|nr:NUDIX hydrolase [uncultured Massilia sp.]
MPTPICHPCPDDDGHPVFIARPSSPCEPDAWHDPARVATAVPGGCVPAALNGLAFGPAGLAGLPPPAGIEEPAFVLPPGLEAAAGAVVVEDDGRVWLVAPTNAFGGYAATFPKGRVDPGASLQATAVREVFEESGLAVEIVAFLADVRRTRTFTRYYLARRVGGNPALMGWETQAVHLVPPARLADVAAHANDTAIIAALGRRAAAGADAVRSSAPAKRTPASGRSRA